MAIKMSRGGEIPLHKKHQYVAGSFKIGDRETIRKYYDEYYPEIPLIQIRKFKEDDYSIVATVWRNGKKTYEHPTLINLSWYEATKRYRELINNPPSAEEIMKSWIFIAD